MKKIGSLENEVNTLKAQLTTTKNALDQEVASRDSQSTIERTLRLQIADRNEEINRLIQSESNAANELTEASILLSRLKNIVQSVDGHFWAKRGNLEVRRACFRSHYTQTLGDKSQSARKYGIPLDMPNASYSLERDPNSRLEYCQRYY